MSAYRDDVAALAARQQALAAEVADKTRELANATHVLEEARAKARLPVLDNIRVASPCTADWAQMSGDDRARDCAQCQKRVYNLSELTRDEAEALILRTGGELCGRYYRRKDGTILLKDCEIGVARGRKRKVLAGVAAVMSSAAGLYAFAPGDSARPAGLINCQEATREENEGMPAAPDPFEVAAAEEAQDDDEPHVVMGDVAYSPADQDYAQLRQFQKDTDQEAEAAPQPPKPRR